MAELKGSQTEKNLLAAFAGESQAFTKYNYYASKAKKDGYVQIGKLFEETANNEKEHAKIWFKLLHGGVMPETTENLKDAAAGEAEVQRANQLLEDFHRGIQKRFTQEEAEQLMELLQRLYAAASEELEEMKGARATNG